jgi:transcriptional activator SPT8
VGIPMPSPVHCIASTACSTYLLTGSQDGFVRCYDFFPSVNGQQVITAQQRSLIGLGESISRSGVGRGWWASEVDAGEPGSMAKKVEPIYSMAVEGDGLWAMTGTQVSRVMTTLMTVWAYQSLHLET